MKRLSSLLNKISVRFIITYLLLLFVTLVICLSIVNQPVDQIETDILNSNLSTMQEKSGLIDEKFKNVLKVAYQIANDPFINDFESNDASGNFFLNLDNARTHLLNYRNKLDDDFVYDYFVYYINQDYVVTPDTCYSSDFFKSYIAKPQGKEDMAPFFQFISSKHVKMSSQRISLQYQSTDLNVICFVVPISNMSSDIENLCLLIPVKYFHQVFLQELAHESCLQIVNESGVPVLMLSNQAHPSFLPDLSQLNIKQNDISYNKKVNGKNFTLTCVTSSQNNWRYLWFQPRAIAMNTLYSMQRNIMVLFFAALLGGIVIAFALTYFNSRPIYHIAEKLYHGRTKRNMPFITFQNISDSLDSLIKDNHSFEEKMVQQKPLLQSVVAGQLLNGCYESFEMIRTNCDYLGFPLDLKLFLVCSVNFLSADHSNIPAYNDMEKMNAVKTCFKELTRQVSEHIFFHDTNVTNITLISCFNKAEQIPQFIQAISKISRALSEQCETLIVIGISNPCSHPFQLPKSRQEAREALNYVQLDKKERIICYSRIPVQKADYFYPIDLEQKLINAVCLGHTKAFDNLFEIIMNENFTKRVLPNGSVKNLYNDILSTCFHLKHKIPISSELSEYLKKNTDYNFVNQQNIEQLLTILKSLCNTVNNRKSDRNKFFIQKILDYLQKDYGNQNLSLTSVASKFNISAGYLSTFFKEQTGKNFTDEVESIRIHVAYQLLKDTNLTINQICPKVGYSNVKSFRRAFERIKGTSPSIARQEILDYT